MIRRNFLALLTTLLGSRFLPAAEMEALSQTTRIDHWNLTHDRIWLGGDFWANPMEDWCLGNGWATCNTTGAKRSIHSLRYQITGLTQPIHALGRTESAR